MHDVDILKIDSDICKEFEGEINNIKEYEDKLKILEELLDKNNTLKFTIHNSIKEACVNLREKINICKSKEKLYFYRTESGELLEEYRHILQTPLKLNFIGKKVNNNKQKNEIIKKYLEVAKRYTNVSSITATTENKISCDNCINRKNFDIIEDNTYICLECFSQQIILKQTSSYKDSDRINITTKYVYDRRVHFRDCINQYQGKQNSTIDPKVYSDLEQELEGHYLLSGDKNTSKEVRFKRVTKQHIMIFLKDLQYTKHYENLNLIYSNLTNKKLDDISYLEDKLLQDFDDLTELYDMMFKHIDRKNFINTQYVLFQLLCRHKHSCDKEDFSILKTVDRKAFHDDICKILFEQLGWNHTPFY